MKIHHLGLALALVCGAPVFAGTVTCISDERPVDGALVKFELNVDADGRAVANLYEEAQSPAISHTESTEMRALTCTIDSGAFYRVDCTGPFSISITELEVAPPPGGNFSRLVNVTTSFKGKSFMFGSQVSAPLQNHCEFHL